MFVSITRKLHANEFFLLLSAFKGPSSPLFVSFPKSWHDKKMNIMKFTFLFFFIELEKLLQSKKRFEIINLIHFNRFYCFLSIVQWKVYLPLMLKKEDILWPLRKKTTQNKCNNIKDLSIYYFIFPNACVWWFLIPNTFFYIF